MSKQEEMFSKLQDDNRWLRDEIVSLNKANSILEEQNKKYRNAILSLENTINSLKSKAGSEKVEELELVEYDEEQCGRHK